MSDVFAAPSTHSHSKDELTILALSADLASLELLLGELQTILFSIQELRHDSHQNQDSNSLDESLAKLNTKLELAQSDFSGLETRFHALSDTPQVLTTKLTTLKASLEGINKDYDLLRDELSEDKWLVVFDSVAQNAENMMSSLERILTACHDFVWNVEINAKKAAPEKEERMALYASLKKSLASKREYYEPSTARVLSILSKGISERKTTNGEVLRRYADMKNRFRNLQERINRVDREMNQIEDVVRETSPSTASTSPSQSKGSSLTPPKGNSPSKYGLGIGRSASPFRKLANRMSSTSTSASSLASSSRDRSDSETTSNSLAQSTSQNAMSPPNKSGGKRFSFVPSFSSQITSQDNVIRSSKSSTEVPTYSRSVSTPVKKLGKSTNAVDSNKPKWNAGKFDPKSDLTISLPKSKPRQSIKNAFQSSSRPLSPSLDQTPSYPASLISRSTTPNPSSYSHHQRAPSPTFSQISTATSPPRMGSSPSKSPSIRPISPASRIPKPRMSFSGRPASPTLTGGDSLDDLLADHNPTSLMQRALSPTPSNHRNVPPFVHPASPTSKSESQEVLADTKQDSMETPTKVTRSLAYRKQLFTPEPMMRARASKITQMQRPSSRNSSGMPPSSSSRPRPSLAPASSSYARQKTPEPFATRSSQQVPPLPGSMDGSLYKPNPYDQLDLEIAAIVNSQPLYIPVQRVDLPLTKLAGLNQKPEEWTARYYFGSVDSGKPVQCKLVERNRAGSKQRRVMARRAGQFVDLEFLLLDLQATIWDWETKGCDVRRNLHSMGGLQYPLLFSQDEGVRTVTSEDQRVTELAIYEILKHYASSAADVDDLRDLDKVELTRELHHNFVDWYLTFELPPFGTGLDASRPWQMYWCTHAFVGLLGFHLTKSQRRRLISTLKQCRPMSTRARPEVEKAGFGGGPGQIMHLAPTYAAVMALATTLQTREEWDEMIDRRALHDWILTLKQADGSFVMHEGGEVDVRASYCAIAVAGLLGILTPDLTLNAAAFLESCQTYEGGFACAAYPFATVSSSMNPPQAEAHGGYAFCALAAYFALCPPPCTSSNVDFDTLYRWAAHMQALPVEGGGFRGRTNKLVDGCYSWWNGGLFQLIQPYLGDSQGQVLFDQEALQEYILLIAQANGGGMQDKPGKANDTYHTCYALSGLSAAQHNMTFSQARTKPALDTSSGKAFAGSNESIEEALKRQELQFANFTAWHPAPPGPVVVGQKGNLINPTHPIFNIGMSHAQRCLSLFYGRSIGCASSLGDFCWKLAM